MSATITGDKDFRRSPLPPRSTPEGSSPIRIALLNSMSDGAIVRTEHQFRNLLKLAAGGRAVEVICCSLPGIPRAGKVRDHIESFYKPIEELWDHTPDAIVLTGTEPRARDLRDEPYWASLTELIDRIEELALPAMFSCLAAHAAVLHTDGVARLPLNDKCFGVFEQEVASDHPLVNGIGSRMWLPHTRWNQVDETELVKAGYEILSWSANAGVGFFAKERKGLWLFCQGHPEYDGPNLLREYRRDVSRFLAKERATYPELPRSYFQESDTRLLNAFKQRALARGDLGVMDGFPRIEQGAATWGAWQPAAIKVFRNWLESVVLKNASADDARLETRSVLAAADMHDWISDSP